jgi:membrane protein
MARLMDVPKVVRSIGGFAFGKRVWSQINEDNLFTWAAALAYSWMFAVFPFLLFLLSLIPYLPERMRNGAQEGIKDYLHKLPTLPAEAADTIWKNIEGNLKNLLHQPKGFVLYAGLLLALWAASSGMAATMSALDRCYELDRGRPFYRQRLLAIALTVVVIVLLLLVICLLPVGTAARDFCVLHGLIGKHSPLLVMFEFARWTLALLFMFFALGLIYYKGPAIRHHFYWITPGSVFSVMVWVMLGFAMRLYIDRVGAVGYERTYGAVGGVAVLLLMFYVDALVLLIGAEINSEIDFEVLKIRRGSRDFTKAEEQDAAEPAAI